jgi:UDP-N-acetylmuramoyl-tripeptide--D-alanyl-D-alanine ligase
LPLLGAHNRINALAATAASIALDQDLDTIKKGPEAVTPAKGRMQEYLLETGVRVIDDTYNANPFSLQAAVNTLATLSGTKILVLGDMRELGPAALDYHKTAGEKIRDQRIDYLFTCGELSREASRAFGKNAQHFDKQDALIHALKPLLKKDVTLLVKGSRSMQMEKIIAAIVPPYK